MFSFFRRKKDLQTFPSKKLQKVINNAIKFLNKSPEYNLPLQEKFSGCGVYILYYNGPFYDQIMEENYKSYFTLHPIYVGKAVPTGWRNGRMSTKKQSYNLWKRIQEHAANIEKVSNLDIKDFRCKYVILDSNLIAPVEASLIRMFRPLWNCRVEGFGNHHPGTTRLTQAKPDWDVLHPGRQWAERMLTDGNDCQIIISGIKRFLGE